MLPDQSRFVLTGDYARDYPLLQERLDRTPVFEPVIVKWVGNDSVSNTSFELQANAPVVEYRKDESWTDLKVSICASAYTSTTAVGVGVTVAVDDVPFSDTIASQHFNSSLDHQNFTGFSRIPNIGAGRHQITVLWAVSAGTATTAPTTDLWSLEVVEILPETY